MNAINDQPSMLERQIIEFVDSHGPAGAYTIAAAFGMNPFTMSGWLRTLCELGELCQLSNGMFVVPSPDPVGGAA